MPDIGVPELLIIAVIVVLLFGPGKAADLGGALGKSIREFRHASKEPDDGHAAPQLAAGGEAPTMTMSSSSGQSASAGNGTAGAAGSHYCTECGSAIGAGQKFCSNCGTRVTVVG